MIEDILLQTFNGIIFSIVHVYTWFKVLRISKINSYLKLFIGICFMALIMILNYFFISNYLNIILITFSLMIVCKLLFNCSYRQAILAPIVSELLVIISDLLFGIVILSVIGEEGYKVFNDYVGTLLPNITVVLLVYVFTRLKISIKLYDLLDKITQRLGKYDLVLFIMILIVTINIAQATIYYKVNLMTLIIINIFIMIAYCFVIFKMFSTKNKYLSVSERFNSTNKSLLEYQSIINRYRIDNHESKGQLRRLRNKIDESNVEALEYLDETVNVRIKNNEKLLNRTKIIPDCDLRTLIDSKLITMDDKKIKNTFHVDKKIQTANFLDIDDRLMEDICNVVAVFLDNAIEAVENLKTKEIQLDVYKIDKYMYISVVNNFKGDIDLSRIDEPGYTTKEDGHGYGLVLVRETVNKNKRLSTETCVDNEIFKQILKIKM